ncbi:MAG: intein-containing RctB family protein [Anaerolineales bacterium]|nr:intein-containing RctB family protein [Anaerolineales bacterium]
MKRSDFNRITPFIHEIPQSFRHDMRVPARFYADGELLEMALEDKSLEQLVNTTTLPGIVKYALAMPDIHQGYGFPIGGVVATALPDGVISPGAVGYDINCLAGESEVLHAFGYTRPIADMAEEWAASSLRCQTLPSGGDDATPIVRYLRQRPRRPVYRVTTESGDSVVATADHPFWTPDGMVALERLRAGDAIGRYPFIGVPYAAPSSQILVDDGDVERALRRHGKGTAGNALGQIVAQLRRRQLLPLRTDSPRLPYLLKLLGYLLGDGTAYFERGSRQGVAWFYGEADDLEAIRADVQALGLTPSRVYRRTRRHAIETPYDQYEFEREETAVKVSSSAFVALLAALGMPLGRKATQDYGLPTWLFDLPLWQQRLFLAALFGAELSTPRAFAERNYNFYGPVLSLNKRPRTAASGRAFLRSVADLLAGFGVRTQKISQRREQIHADGQQAVRLRLILSSQTDSLINLWGRVGFEYNAKRQQLGLLATAYLQRKREIVRQRDAAAETAVALQAAGAAPAAIYAQLGSMHVNQRFLERSLYGGRKSGARVSGRFERFADYCARARQGLAAGGMVWATIAAIEPLPFDADVYDFTVAHPDHNFIANGFVVSNCGVRLLATHLDYEEVKPHLSDLASALQVNCPSGVGQGGEIRLKAREIEQLLENGSHWARKNGYATEMDVVRTEENGRLPRANPDKVSERARKRGMDQIGTLGAGNHFIEVDVVDAVYDETAAQRMGLRPGQIVAQIHCGSRGLGHQVCTDYVRVFQQVIHKYGIVLPDRELVCAPLSSPEGQDYLGAMQAAANFAFANRQVLTHLIRRSFEEALRGKVRNSTVYQVYDIAHNMAKIETHEIDGRQLEVCVHRKGATRAFGPGSAVLPDAYRDIGQPVLVPGSMGTASWVLVGTDGSMAQSFGSTCHGAGRTMSRREAKRSVRGSALRDELEAGGIHIRAGSMAGLAEEAPTAYKDVDRVIEVVHGAGIARKVARIVPVAVVKG